MKNRAAPYHISTVITALLILSFTGCSSRDYRSALQKPEELFYQGRYTEAARLLLPEINKPGKNQLLFMMEGGYILHASGDYDTSNSLFNRAARTAQVVPISISQEAAALFTDQRVTNYRGEDYEKVLINMYAGINFLVQGSYEKARVEFKAVNEQLNRLRHSSSRSAYKQNLMAKYLSAICYELIGDRENDADDLEFAYIELKQILKIDPDLTFITRDLQRLSMKLGYDDDYQQWQSATGEFITIDDTMGELIIIFQTGRTAIKASRGKLLEDPTMKPLIQTQIAITLASRSVAAGITTAMILGILSQTENPIPKLVDRKDTVHHMKIIAQGESYSTIELENISQTAMQTMSEKYPELSKKVAASIAIKAVSSLAAGIVARETVRQSSGNSLLGDVLGLFAGGITGAALFSTMKPDLRCWHTLPASLQITRIPLPAGTHTITKQYIGFDGKPAMSNDVTITLEPGEKIFLTERSIE